jgi:hypothetical protein
MHGVFNALARKSGLSPARFTLNNFRHRSTLSYARRLARQEDSAMASKQADILVGRRYLAKGYLDQALELFTRNADHVTSHDWIALRDKLLERGRIQDMVRVCELGHVPIPSEQLLVRGDRALITKDIDLVINLYELAGADRARWEKVVDVLVEMPDRKRQAVTIADRYLVDPSEAAPAATRPAPTPIKAIK